jgi:hypothetical protein
MFGRVMRQASDWNRFHGRPSQGDADFLLQIRALMRYDHATFQKANTSVGVLNTCVNPPTAPSKRANRGNLTEPDLQTRHFRPVAACMGSYGFARLKDREFPSRSGHSEVLRGLVFPGSARVTLPDIIGYLTCGYHLSISILALLCHTQILLTDVWES